MKGKRLVVLLACVLSVGYVSSCGGGSTGSTSAGPSAQINALTQQEVTDLLYMREEEKLARDLYLSFYQLYKDGIFDNIASSEQNHMDAVKRVLDLYALADPVGNNPVGVFQNQEIAGIYTQLLERGKKSLQDALLAGAYVEEHDIVDLQKTLDTVRKSSNSQALINLYENLMCGSRNHMRAFASRLGSYRAQLLPQEVVDSIISTPLERCGW